MLGDPLDDATLAGRITSLEDDNHLEPFVLDPLHHLHEFELQLEQFFLVATVLDLFWLRAFVVVVCVCLSVRSDRSGPLWMRSP